MSPVRSIPACAGEPTRGKLRPAGLWVYPRVCGGTAVRLPMITLPYGLSPRVRGNLPTFAAVLNGLGSIPACAGEPEKLLPVHHEPRVYPRVCGGTYRKASTPWSSRGLSPRVRGNRQDVSGRHAVQGSIPACAGEPKPPCLVVSIVGVYPRVCGGTSTRARMRCHGWGLSPRVRGNRHACQQGRRDGRSIPACAGEPPSAGSPASGWRVYPRVCGGTAGAVGVGLDVLGLSPRVRGNRARRHGGGRRQGSIPACAGEPGGRYGGYGQLWVYPRVCGGTHLAKSQHWYRPGLSPRVRGNPPAAAGPAAPARSIPACAGEPDCRPSGRACRPVYPRVCGGTSLTSATKCGRIGLSPRVRGNPPCEITTLVPAGSIPACAGEPAGSCWPRCAGKVYPRVCGGTRLPPFRPRLPAGLSPRVRGNLVDECHEVRADRSIPACAGEPGSAAVPWGRCGVYPRVCGGTRYADLGELTRYGLSPRVRGNPEPNSCCVRYSGSIPACAGEPDAVSEFILDGRVYPRVCGGTAFWTTTTAGR